MIGGRQTYLYFEGTPLFPFGHGLSYASFSYGGLTTRFEDGTLHVSFTVGNTGDVTADEVAQLYTRAMEPSVPRPRRELAAHRRVTLAPGEVTEITFRVPMSAFAFRDVAQGRQRVAPGRYEILVGASSEDIRLAGTVGLDGEPSVPRPVMVGGLDAVDFDDQSDTEIVDRAKTSGDSVAPVAGRRGELVLRDCDFGKGAAGITVEAAGEGTVELSLGDGPVLAVLTLSPDTAGPYDYATVSVPVVVAAGVHDVRLGLRGPLRLARVAFSV